MSKTSVFLSFRPTIKPNENSLPSARCGLHSFHPPDRSRAASGSRRRRPRPRESPASDGRAGFGLSHHRPRRNSPDRSRDHARSSLARLLDQRRRLRPITPHRLDSSCRNHRRSNAVPHPHPPSPRPADGLRLRECSNFSRPIYRGQVSENREDPHRCEGKLAGVPRGLHSRQGPPRARSDGCSRRYGAADRRTG